MDIGGRLQCLRNEYGYTQQYVCDKMNIEQSTLANYEKNRRIPKGDMLVRFADFYRTSVDYLLGRTEERHDKITPEQKIPADLTSFINRTDIMFDGNMYHIDENDRQKLHAALSLAFWDAKRLNKRKKD